MFLHVLEHTLEDTLRMLPFLYLAYLFIEYIEQRQGQRIERALAGGGRWGVIPGAVLGCVPQCGFSAMAANLYGGRVITLGTLMAVFLATSDEAVPLLMAMPEKWPALAGLLAVKIVWALAAGLLLDTVLRPLLPAGLVGGYTGHADEVDCHEEHGEHSNIFLAALRHTISIYLYIFAFSLLIGLVVEAIGDEAIAAFLASLGPLQPAVAALFGMIPNCASSVLLTQLYLSGTLPFSSVAAGLCSGAGIGLLVLWEANPSRKQNLFITLQLWVLGTVAGLVLALFGL